VFLVSAALLVSAAAANDDADHKKEKCEYHRKLLLPWLCVSAIEIFFVALAMFEYNINNVCECHRNVCCLDYV
jgi:hypothetical protein